MPLQPTTLLHLEVKIRSPLVADLIRRVREASWRILSLRNYTYIGRTHMPNLLGFYNFFDILENNISNIFLYKEIQFNIIIRFIPTRIF